MRFPAIAGFTLITLFAGAAAAEEGSWRLTQGANTATLKTGVETLPGTGQVTFIRNDRDGLGTLEQTFSADNWRGKRVRLTLRLKSEADAWLLAAFQVEKRNDISLRARPQANRAGAWQTHQFVMDVPDNATQLAVDVQLHGKGTGWLDDVALEAVGAEVPVSTSWRVYTPPNIVTASRRGYTDNTSRDLWDGMGNRSVYGPDPAPNPYANWAPSTLLDLRNAGQLPR